MSFQDIISEAYQFKGDSAILGCAMQDGQPVEGLQVKMPLKTLNRHGLVAGATGTGKTKTLQVLAECLSDASVPVMVMDIKGDLSGIGAPGTTNEHIEKRCKAIGINYTPSAYPVEFLTLSNEPGTKLKATITEFGPILLSKILELNDTQEGIVSMLFKYCDDKQLPILDLKDFIRVLQYITNEGKDELKDDYGNVSGQSTGTILRKVIGLQQQGADNFFAEKSFEVEDLMRMDDMGRGMISVLRVTDMQDRPKLFSTFILQMLAELYGSLPEEGDLDRPKLVLFIDEAHLIFQDASKVLLTQIENVVKLIRSKGVGIFFITQNPTDIPQSVLSQLGFKVQHALRAFTAKDRTDIKKAAENFPLSDFYKTEDLLTQMGIGEAFITLLNEKGIPTPLVHTLLRAPNSRMDVLTEGEINAIVNKSKIAAKYNQEVDNKSAYEMLNEKLAIAQEEDNADEEVKSSGRRRAKEKGTLESILDNPTARQVGRTAASILTRTLLGALGLGGTTRSRKKTGWF